RWIPLHGWIKSKAGRRTGVFLFASFASFAFRARCSSSFTRRGCSSSTSISFGAMSQIVSTLIRSASQTLMVGTIAFLIGCGGPDFVQDPLDYLDRKSTRLNSSHVKISYAVFCLKKKNV